MANDPISQEDWTVHALNIHGIFFERRCADIVAGVPDWSLVSTNYPVEYPPPNGPWRGKESSLDIRARKLLPNNQVLDIQIECKKANPEFVNWIFFPKRGITAAAPFRTTVSRNELPESGTGPWSTTVFMQGGVAEMPIASDSREVRGDYLSQKGGNKTKTSNASIQDASYQVAIANRAIVHEDGELLRRARNSGQHPAPPWTRKTYIPIIVTTARLFQAYFSTNDVDVGSGEIPLSSAMLTSVNNLLYEYPLPKHLQHSPADPLPALTGVENESFTRMDIIVVHAQSLAALLNNLK
jgi:hypothetical protein